MKYLFFLFLLIFCLGCSRPSSPPPANQLAEAALSNKDSMIAPQDKVQFENIQVEMDEPIAFASAKRILIPIFLEEKYIDKGFPDHSYVNIAVIGDDSAAARLLFSESVVIKNIKTFEPQVDGVKPWEEFEGYYSLEDTIYDKLWPREFEGLIFFELCKFRNKACDYQRLFCYDLRSGELRQLSSENTSVTSYSFFNGTSNVLVTCRIDNNQDGTFDEKEDENISFVDLKAGASSPRLLLPLDSLKKAKHVLTLPN